MQDPGVSLVTDLTALKVAFEDHKNHEEKWQDGIDEKFAHLDRCIDEKFTRLEALIAPISRQLQEDTQALFGVSPDKDNGIHNDVKVLKLWRETVDGRWMKAVAIMFAIQLLFNGAGFFLAKQGYFQADTKAKTEQVAPR
jgi:hypothetical protein